MMPTATILGRRAVRLLCVALLAASGTVAFAQDAQEINRLIRAGQLGQAASRVDALLAKNPKDAQARFLKGVILSEQGKSNDAIAMFQALTEDYPELPEPYNNLASLYAAKGQYEKAKTALEMAIQTNPSYGTAYENLGDVYAKLASQAYDKAMQLDKANSTAPAKLAAIRNAFGGGAKAAAQQPASAQQPAASPAPKAEPAKSGAAPAGQPSSAGSASTSVKQTAMAAPSASAAAAGGDASAVLQAVTAWANAWASRDIDAYLRSYSASFAPEGRSRDEWEAARRTSFPSTRSVQVSLEQPQVNMLGDSEAEVSFLQHFRSERAKLNTRKVLRLKKENGVWHIAQERIIP